MILKDPAGGRQMFVNAYLIYKMGDSDYFDEIVQVKIPREPFVADQRVVIKKLKNGWKIWGSGLNNTHNNSGANSITMDKTEFDRYIKLGINNIEQKALSENKMTNKRKITEMVRRIIKEDTFNIDRTKNIIGQQTYDSILKCNKQELETWLSDLKKEMQREPESSTRFNKLKHEERLIKYRLEIK
jgi:hypothetical protein